MLFVVLCSIDIESILGSQSFNLGLLSLSCQWHLVLLLHDLKLLHLCLCDLSIMFKDAFSFFRSLKVLALNTFAIIITRNSSLKAFTILFQTFATLAVASFCVSLMATLAYQISWTLLQVWIESGSVILVTLICLLLNNLQLLIGFLWWSWPQYWFPLVFNWSTDSSNWNSALTNLWINIISFRLILRNFCSECVRISI